MKRCDMKIDFRSTGVLDALTFLSMAVAVVAVTAPRPVMAEEPDTAAWKRAATARSGCTLFVYEHDKEECVQFVKEIGQLETEASSCNSSITKAQAEKRLEVAKDKLEVHEHYLELNKETYNVYERVEGENKEYAREIMESLSGQIGGLKDKIHDYERNVETCKDVIENAKE
jgi:hypothetical protein